MNEEGQVVIPWAVDDNTTDAEEAMIVKHLAEIQKDVPCMQLLHINRTDRLTNPYENVCAWDLKQRTFLTVLEFIYS